MFRRARATLAYYGGRIANSLLGVSLALVATGLYRGVPAMIAAGVGVAALAVAVGYRAPADGSCSAGLCQLGGA
ncbi:MAG: hypothetical protein ABEJ89_05515 [Haloarculaceae archaeon]